ncbi:hypothetical protein A2U01_0063361, partial [Trifolium medium]|nr:hypothetical protein [Trifolium medium]
MGEEVRICQVCGGEGSLGAGEEDEG